MKSDWLISRSCRRLESEILRDGCTQAICFLHEKPLFLKVMQYNLSNIGTVKEFITYFNDDLSVSFGMTRKGWQYRQQTSEILDSAMNTKPSLIESYTGQAYDGSWYTAIVHFTKLRRKGSNISRVWRSHVLWFFVFFCSGELHCAIATLWNFTKPDLLSLFSCRINDICARLLGQQWERTTSR